VRLYDPTADLVYVNLQDRNELAVIALATDKVVGRYPVVGCKGNHGMALDVAHHRAFVACQVTEAGYSAARLAAELRELCCEGAKVFPRPAHPAACPTSVR
jgi:hypothetical protein